ncbi:MAG TPA: 8-amino-7-oxononanoate synthase [Planctomycetaceae bacterium]|nr:8-amino-7-oxononanoate synthase [Planctomycetaceae bacterium]
MSSRDTTTHHSPLTIALPWLADDLDDLARQNLRRERRTVTPLPDGRCRVEDRTLVNFASNDYLNLANDPRVVEAARQAFGEAGAGARASALVCGRTAWHEQLEARLATFERQEAAVLFPTGYAANVGTIAALAGPDDLVCCDRLNHSSLVDGCRLSRAKLLVYRHDRLDRLARALHKARTRRRRLIVTDGVFSMDGVLAPLRALCELADKFDAALIVDEAHASGVFGEHGRGAAEHLGVEDRGIVRIGTLSKAVGALGGFVAGPQPLIDWLWNTARTQMFSTALPPAVCAAATAAIDIIESEPWRRERLHALSERLRQPLAAARIRTVPNSTGPIVPVVVGLPEAAVAAGRALEEAGFLVASNRPPTVPRGTSRLRISLTCAHGEDDVDRLAGALVQTMHAVAQSRPVTYT